MSIKQAIEALQIGIREINMLGGAKQAVPLHEALAALRSMPQGEPFAYAVYFPDQPTEELVHDLDELLDDMTNREHTVTALFATPHTEAVRMSEAEILDKATLLSPGCKADLIVFARAVEQATAARLGVKMGDRT